MSGIGGIMDIQSYGVDMERLALMSRALSLRGKKRSTAFYEGRVGMFFNSSSTTAFGVGEDRQPNICKRRGNIYALCIDGEEFNSSAVLEKYLVCGVEAIGSFDGAFAVAIYDGSRDMLVLARDRRGRKPLFYTYDGKRLYFSSEVKGLLDIEGYTAVNRDCLARHLTSPVSVYGAEDIYCDIEQVLPGECILFTSMGMSRFFYRDIRAGEKKKPRHNEKREQVISAYPSEYTDGLSEYLAEALIAFDYPQFDAYMPSLCALLRSAVSTGKERIYFEDAERVKNIRYAYEREDRLGNLYGISAVGVLQKRSKMPCEGSLVAMKEALYSKLESIDVRAGSALKSILGAARFDMIRRSLDAPIRKKEDAEDSIRILGMLLQTLEWTEANRLLIKGTDFFACCDCM